MVDLSLFGLDIFCTVSYYRIGIVHLTIKVQVNSILCQASKKHKCAYILGENQNQYNKLTPTSGNKSKQDTSTHLSEEELTKTTQRWNQPTTTSIFRISFRNTRAQAQAG